MQTLKRQTQLSALQNCPYYRGNDCSLVPEIVEQTVTKRMKTLRNTKVIASRHIKKENGPASGCHPSPLNACA